jgi:predicted ATPase
VAPTVAWALGVRGAQDRPPTEQLLASVRDRHLLPVLDNFEQIAAAAPPVARFLAACPRLTIAVTSRALLRVSGEHDYPAPPLALSVPIASVETVEPEAVRLFAERARAADPAFRLTAEYTPDVVLVANRCSVDEPARRFVDGTPTGS